MIIYNLPKPEDMGFTSKPQVYTTWADYVAKAHNVGCPRVCACKGGGEYYIIYPYNTNNSVFSLYIPGAWCTNTACCVCTTSYIADYGFNLVYCFKNDVFRLISCACTNMFNLLRYNSDFAVEMTYCNSWSFGACGYTIVCGNIASVQPGNGCCVNICLVKSGANFTIYADGTCISTNCYLTFGGGQCGYAGGSMCFYPVYMCVKYGSVWYLKSR